MTAILAGTLLLLALVDSLSIGTLLIPIFFLLAPGRLPAGKLLVYLATIAGFYFVVGVAVALGAGALFDGFEAMLQSTPARILQLVVGVGLIVLSFWIGRKRTPDDAQDRPPGRITRWRERALSPEGRPTAIIALALGAGILELATMLPYLGAIGLITTSPLDTGTRLGVLALYCVVMIAPALVLLALRVVARRRIEPALARFGDWLQRNSAENTAWIVGIVGFLLARDAAMLLGVFEAIDRLN